MKLLSMNVEGHNRAGLLMGQEVLNVTAFFELLEMKGEWIEAATELPEFHHIEGAYRDRYVARCVEGELK